VRVKNQLGQVMVGTTVGFFASGVGCDGNRSLRSLAARVQRRIYDRRNGIATAAPGLSFANANQEYTVTVRAGTLQVTLQFTRYAALSTITPVGPIVELRPRQHAASALQVTTSNPAPIEWTVLPGSGGASATFANGALGRTRHPARHPSRCRDLHVPALTANGHRGHVRAQGDDHRNHHHRHVLDGELHAYGLDRASDAGDRTRSRARRRRCGGGARQSGRAACRDPGGIHDQLARARWISPRARGPGLEAIGKRR
jgi:hypothetical protein